MERTDEAALVVARSAVAEQEPGTVSAYLGGWLVGKQSLRPSTRQSYALHVRKYLDPYLGDLPLAELRPVHIERMYQHIVTRGTEDGGHQLSVATLRRIHATLASALNTAVRRGLIERNPAATVELPPTRRPRIATWTADDLGPLP